MTSQPVASVQTATLLVYSDSQAQQAIASPQFLSDWRVLAGQCPWGTALQSPEFVGTWYETYGELYRPLLFVRYSASGGMDGLMALAVERASGRLTFAGAHQAEYNVWLALPGEQSFILECLDRLRQLGFPSLSFTYLPPGTPLDWLKNGWSNRSTLRAVQRPLLTVDNVDALVESLSKKKNRRRLEKLQEAGPLTFLEVETCDALDNYYDEIIDFYDFRIGAVHGTCPFRDDPRKRVFYRALMAKGLLHVTAMTIGETLVAAHIGIRNKNEVMLGIMGHSPFVAIHSPGKLHILHLGLVLHERGFVNLDLTPGGDAYKEDRATRYDEAHELTVFLNSKALRSHRRSAALASAAKRTLRILHLDKAKLSRLRSLVRSPRHVPRAVASWISSSTEMRFYRMKCSSAAESSGVHRDRLRDLLYYEPRQPEAPSKQEFLSTALEAIESGAHVYSVVRDGALVASARLLPAGRNSGAATASEYPPNSALIADIHVAPEERMGAEFLKHIAHDAANLAGAELVYIAVAAQDRALRSAVEEAGFQYQNSVVREVRFGAAKTTRVMQRNYS